MISLGLAKELQAAGLKPRHNECEMYWIAEVGEVMHVSGGYAPDWEDVWLPSLSRLLAEVEGQGWWPDIDANSNNKKIYVCILQKWDDAGMYPVYRKCDFLGETREEAAGRALLWILQRKIGQADCHPKGEEVEAM